MPDLSYLPQIALSGIAVGCIYGLIGIGFCVIYNASGIVNFAQGAFVMMGGMIAYSALTAARPAVAGRGRASPSSRSRPLASSSSASWCGRCGTARRPCS